jgi:hypothetical protein
LPKIHRLALIKLCKRTMSSVKMVGCHANTTRVVIKVVHSFKHREELVRGSLGVLWAVGVLRRRRISSCTPKIDHASIESGCRHSKLYAAFWELRHTFTERGKKAPPQSRW